MNFPLFFFKKNLFCFISLTKYSLENKKKSQIQALLLFCVVQMSL